MLPKESCEYIKPSSPLFQAAPIFQKRELATGLLKLQRCVAKFRASKSLSQIRLNIPSSTVLESSSSMRNEAGGFSSTSKVF
jgi:hypothetical protein